LSSKSLVILDGGGTEGKRNQHLPTVEVERGARWHFFNQAARQFSIMRNPAAMSRLIVQSASTLCPIQELNARFAWAVTAKKQPQQDKQNAPLRWCTGDDVDHVRVHQG
jgi:hypothetical protein